LAGVALLYRRKRNASCESFIKTLKREEIYANRYDNLEHLRANIEEFIEEYYNRQRLHSVRIFTIFHPGGFHHHSPTPGFCI